MHKKPVVLNGISTPLLGKINAKYSSSSDKVKLDFDCKGDAITIIAKCSEPTEFTSFQLTADYSYDKNCCIFVNGYQSWTDTMEYPRNAKQYTPAPIMKKIAYSGIAAKSGFSCSGDYSIYKPSFRQGRFYGFSYGYVRVGESITLFGSLDDSTGYTIFDFDTADNKIYISVDLEGRKLAEGDNVLAKITVLSGGYDDVFDRYFKAMGIKCRPCPLRKGYTTWYNYYADIDSSIIERDLNALNECGCETDVFQIDDGYQRAVGDWLELKKDFFNNFTEEKNPSDAKSSALETDSGLKSVADSIHSKGMLAGLWLAPFAVTPASEVFRQHKDWLIKGKNGKPAKAGLNWGGFYALDIYNEEVREHLKKVFDVVLNEWGFDLVKLDFLYAAAFLPYHGNCRAKIMYDAMDLLRECVGEKLILGCGVPLMPAFGKVDYCRIGSDISLNWHKNSMDIREGVSTSHAVANSAFRRHLDGRAFGNDPDVFLLRNGNLDMTFRQKTALAEINKLFGSVLFTSDNVAEYNDLQMKALRHVFDSERAKILDVSMDENFDLTVKYDYGKGAKTLRIALYSGAINKGEEFNPLD